MSGYTVDLAGFGVQPWVSLGVAAAAAAVLAVFLPRQDKAGGADLIAWLGIVAFVIAMLLRLSWPQLLPPGRGSDLTHHLLLVDYIEHNGHLVHDRGLSGAMGEMAHYTPGAHLLAVMAGRWFGVDGLRAFYPVVVACAALTAGFVFLIARRVAVPLPFALSAAILLWLPARYFSGAFTHDGFLAQSVSILFAVATWWAITVWHDRPAHAVAWTIAVFLAATFLSWPIFIGPTLLVFLSMLMRRDLTVPERQRQLGIVVVPLLAAFLVHSWDRWGWMVIVRTSGAVLQPSLESMGWFLPALAAIGAIMARSDARARIAVVLLFVIALQAVTLFVIATMQGAATPYMALKMVYFAIYPMTVLGALALARLAGSSRVTDSIGWIVAALLLVAARPALSAPLLVPAVNADLFAAGKWVRENGSAACTDYLVADADVAYWLHLAVLGNPRSSARTAEIDRYDARSAVAPWITAEGRSFAIADLRLLPDEVRSRVTIRARYGNAAVITRRDATIKGCD